MGRATGLEDFPIVRLVERHDLDVAEPLVHGPPRRARDPAMELLVGQYPDGRTRHALEVVRRVEEAVFLVGDDFRQPADAGGNHRHLAGHRLERRQAEALLRRRQQEHVRNGEQREHLVLLPDEVHVAGEPQRPRPLHRFAHVRPVAHHQQPGTGLAADSAEHLDRGRDTLHRAEVRDVDHDLLVGRARSGCGDRARRSGDARSSRGNWE